MAFWVSTRSLARTFCSSWISWMVCAWAFDSVETDPTQMPIVTRPAKIPDSIKRRVAGDMLVSNSLDD